MLFVFAAILSVQDEPARNPRESVMAKLTSMQIAISFENEPLENVVEHLREQTRLNFHIDAKVAKVKELTVTARLKDVRLISAIRLMLGQLDLAAVYRDGMIVITTREEVDKEVVTRVYDVRDLNYSPPDFPGPRIELEPRGAGGGGGAGPEVKFVMLEAPSRPSSVEEGLAELIRATT
ncbi:MAG TPA: hypothetical protein VI643_03155, partial [Planctomycetota bacterium]|nr:hypothetical protein [Planctomycetota bacterium]